MPIKRKFTFHNQKSGAALHIKLTPHAKKNEIVGILEDGTLKIRVTAPPVEGKANKAVIDFLAKALKIHRERIEIVAGFSGKEKIISFTHLSASELDERIQKYLS